MSNRQSVRRPLSIQDSVCLRDRLWFEAHPGATEYTRAYVPGEYSAEDIAACQLTHFQEPPPGSLIRVRQLATGIRTRGLMVPDTEVFHAA